MASHGLRISFNETTGEVRIVHYCTVEAGGMAITSSEPVELTDGAAYAASLKGLIDTNRKQMEAVAQAAAVEHVAAVQGVQRRGKKQVKMGGTMSASGKAGG